MCNSLYFKQTKFFAAVVVELFARHRLNVQDVSILVILAIPGESGGNSDGRLVQLSIDVAGAGGVADLQGRGEGWDGAGRGTVGRGGGGGGGGSAAGIWDSAGLLTSVAGYIVKIKRPQLQHPIAVTAHEDNSKIFASS